MTLVCFAVDYKETKSSAKLFSHLFLIDVEHCTPNRGRELNKQHAMVGDNSLSVKECIWEANSLAWKEMQYRQWKFPQVYTWEIHTLAAHQGTTKHPNWILQLFKHQPDLLGSVVACSGWNQSLCVFQPLSGFLGTLVRSTAMILPADVQRSNDYW